MLDKQIKMGGERGFKHSAFNLQFESDTPEIKSGEIRRPQFKFYENQHELNVECCQA